MPQFLAAYESVDGSAEEVVLSRTLEAFLEENQAELVEEYNSENDQKLPIDYKFVLPGDEELIAKAINAHNALQF